VSPLHSASVNSICWAPYELGLALAAASSDGSLSVLTYQPDGSWFAEKVRRFGFAEILIRVVAALSVLTYQPCQLLRRRWEKACGLPCCAQLTGVPLLLAVCLGGCAARAAMQC